MSARVIVADDHPLILDGVAAIFDGTDLSVIGRFADGASAREAILAHRPEGAVLDINMPGLSGLDLLREARRDDWPTKIVLLTASLDPAPLVEAVNLNVDGLVLKHAAGEVLLLCLRSALAGTPWIDKEAMKLVMDAMSRAKHAGPELTPRERQVAELVTLGLRNKEIANELRITEGTVKMYLHTLYDKLGIGSRTELAMLIRDLG
jgi:two-component system nitrate/nitrite response regulator NarP